MKSLEIVSLFFRSGARAAADVLQHARDTGVDKVDFASPSDALNLLLIQLLAQRTVGRVTEQGLQDAARKLDTADVMPGRRVVYALLLFDLAREAGVTIKIGEEVSATGSDIDWKLLDAFARSTPTFHELASELQAKHAFALMRGAEKS